MDKYIRLNELTWKERRELNKLIRKQKKRLSSTQAYSILFHANKKGYVANLSEDERQWLSNHTKGTTVCLCCPCFAWEFDESKAISGCICTLGGNPNPYGKGKCPYEQPEEEE